MRASLTPKTVSSLLLLNVRRIHFSFKLWLWCYPSHHVKVLPGSPGLAESCGERAGSSHLESDLENVILPGQKNEADKPPFRGRQNTGPLWGSALSKHVRHHDVWKHIKSFVIRGHKVNSSLGGAVIHPVFTVDPPLLHIWNHRLFKQISWQQQGKLTWGHSQQDPNNIRGHAGHRLGPGHSWLMQLGLSGKWLSKQGPEWLPLTGTTALSLLIRSKEPQSNTQRHTVTSNNTGQSGGTRNESHWPSRKTDASLLIISGHREQLNCRTGAMTTEPLFRGATLPSTGIRTRDKDGFICATFQLLDPQLCTFTASWVCYLCVLWVWVAEWAFLHQHFVPEGTRAPDTPTGRKVEMSKVSSAESQPVRTDGHRNWITST